MTAQKAPKEYIEKLAAGLIDGVFIQGIYLFAMKNPEYNDYSGWDEIPNGHRYESAWKDGWNYINVTWKGENHPDNTVDIKIDDFYIFERIERAERIPNGIRIFYKKVVMRKQTENGVYVEEESGTVDLLT